MISLRIGYFIFIFLVAYPAVLVSFVNCFIHTFLSFPFPVVNVLEHNFYFGFFILFYIYNSSQVLNHSSFLFGDAVTLCTC